MSQLLKETIPDIPIIWGGPQVTIDPKHSADLTCVDLVITHQGEAMLRSVIEEISRGAFKRPATTEMKIMRGRMPDSLDSLAWPARHLVDLSKYGRKSTVMDIWPTDTISSSRGCPFACTFCSSKIVWERRYHKRSPKSVVDEMERLIQDYGSRGFYFREDNFTVDKAHVRGICDEILSRKMKIRWECESRVDTLSKEDLVLMKRAGCSGLWCGVESGSQRTLDAAKKGYKPEQVLKFYSWCRELRIPAGASFMLGFPGETPGDLTATYELARKLPCAWTRFGAYIGFPGSELYERTLKEGLYDARWDDILIARNEYFSASQLHALEAAMNGEAKPAPLTLARKMKIALTRPERVFEAAANKISAWRSNSGRAGFSRAQRGETPENFYDLLKRFTGGSRS